MTPKWRVSAPLRLHHCFVGRLIVPFVLKIVACAQTENLPENLPVNNRWQPAVDSVCKAG